MTLTRMTVEEVREAPVNVTTMLLQLLPPLEGKHLALVVGEEGVGVVLVEGEAAERI